MTILLELEEARVIAFAEPYEALHAAQSGRYDVVVSDIGMSDMNGNDLMRALRQLPHIQPIPSIALTGYGAESDIEKTLQAGFNRHLNKPGTYEMLIETLRALTQTPISGPGEH